MVVKRERGYIPVNTWQYQRIWLVNIVLELQPKINNEELDIVNAQPRLLNVETEIEDLLEDTNKDDLSKGELNTMNKRIKSLEKERSDLHSVLSESDKIIEDNKKS
jgi:hypothetical protein